MATTTVGNQPFSRIVESRKTSSWSIGIPIAIVVVIAVALLAYFAAKASQARDQLALAEQSAQQQQQQLTQVQQRLGLLDAELNRLREPGRTTVILQSAASGKRGKAETAAWGAATWGEQADGKSWMRLNAYGLSAARDSVLAGKLDANADGSACVEGKDLPGVDQGKMALVSIDDENVKTHGPPLLQVQLPKLSPTQHAAPPAQASAKPEPAKPSPKN